MKLLVDFHHACLFEAHQLTFGDRFGWQVFAPWGLDWYNSWRWSFEREHHGDAVARQYLLGIFEDGVEDDGYITVADRKHPGRTIRGVSLERALSEPWDFAMSSVPTNAAGFRRFARETGAKWGIHVGNQWGDEAWASTPEFAIMTTTSAMPGSVPHVITHQEFSLMDFRYEPPVGFGPVSSLVNCFPEMTTEYEGNFLPIARENPDFDWRVYGAYGTAPDDEFKSGNLDSDLTEGMAMRYAGAIWHSKKWSDGFGHVVHRAFAVGRPVIGYAGYYADKLAGPLWVEGETSIDVARHSHSEIADILRGLRDDPEKHLRMCEAAAARFNQVVSFDEDAERVYSMLAGIV